MKIIITFILASILLAGCTKSKGPLDYYACLEFCKSWKTSEEFNPETVYRVNFDCLNGALIPNFAYENMNGTRSQIRNKKEYILLNLWFIGCSPCIEEIPTLVELNRLENLSVIGLALDSKAELVAFLKEHSEIQYEIIPDGKALIADTLKIPFGYPLNYLIDPNNRIIQMYDKLTPSISSEIIKAVSDL